MPHGRLDKRVPSKEILSTFRSLNARVSVIDNFAEIS
jgi:hypothetical protein